MCLPQRMKQSLAATEKLLDVATVILEKGGNWKGVFVFSFRFSRVHTINLFPPSPAFFSPFFFSPQSRALKSEAEIESLQRENKQIKADLLEFESLPTSSDSNALEARLFSTMSELSRVSLERDDLAMRIAKKLQVRVISSPSPPYRFNFFSKKERNKR